MPATVSRPGKQPVAVKNLGWLLRHAGEVTHIEVKPPISASWDALMVAHLSDGGTYQTDWASRQILAHWVERPCLKEVPVVWEITKPTP